MPLISLGTRTVEPKPVSRVGWRGNTLHLKGLSYQPFEMFYDVRNEGLPAWRQRMRRDYRHD